MAQSRIPNNNKTFFDDSTAMSIVTPAGNATKTSYSPFGSNWSQYFDGNDTVQLPSGSTAFTFGTGDFTVETWAYFKYIPSTYVHLAGTAVSSGGFGFGLSGSSNTGAMYMTTSVTGYVSGTQSIEVDKWYHLAWTRKNGLVNFWLNGVLNYSPGVVSTDITETGGTVGGIGTQYYTFGYISNLRVYKGVSLYNSNFTPSTKPSLPAETRWH